jgi:hypothetical protein
MIFFITPTSSVITYTYKDGKSFNFLKIHGINIFIPETVRLLNKEKAGVQLLISSNRPMNEFRNRALYPNTNFFKIMQLTQEKFNKKAYPLLDKHTIVEAVELIFLWTCTTRDFILFTFGLF